MKNKGKADFWSPLIFLPLEKILNQITRLFLQDLGILDEITHLWTLFEDYSPDSIWVRCSNC